MTRLRVRRTTKMKADIWLLILLQLFRVCSSDVSPTQLAEMLMYGADARPKTAVANPTFGDMSVAATAVPGKSPLASLSEEHRDFDWSHIRPFGSPNIYFQPAPLPSPPSGVPHFTSVTTLTNYSSVDRVVELDTNDGPGDSRPTDGLSQPPVPSDKPELARDARSVLLTDDDDDDVDDSEVTIEVIETTEIVIPDEYLLPQQGRPSLQQEDTQFASEIHLSPSSFEEGMYFPPLAPEASPMTAVSFESYVTTSQNTQYPWQALTPIFSTLGNYQFEPHAYSSNYYQGDYFQPPVPLPLFSMPYQFTDYNIPLQPYPLPPYAVNSHIPNPPYPKTLSDESDFRNSSLQRHTPTSTSFESLPQKTVNSNSYTDDPFLLTPSNYQLPQQMSFPSYYPLREKTFADTYQSQYNYWSPPLSSNPAGITPFLVPPFPFGMCPAMPVGTNQNFPSPMELSFTPPQAADFRPVTDLSHDHQPAISDGLDGLISFGDYTPTSQSVLPFTSYYPEDSVLSPSEYILPHQIFAEYPPAEYPVSDLDYPLYPEPVAVNPPGYPTSYVLPPPLPERHFSPQFPETLSPVGPSTAGHPLKADPHPYGSNIPPISTASAPISYLEDHFVSPPLSEPTVSYYPRDLDLPLSSTEISVTYEIFYDYPSGESPMTDFTSDNSTYFSPDYTLAALLDFIAADPLAYTADYFLPPSLTEQHFPPQFLEEYSPAGYPTAGETPRAVTYPYDDNIPSLSYTAAPVSYPEDYFVPTPYPQKYFSTPPITPYYPGSSLLPHFHTEFEEYHPAGYQPAEYPLPILTSAHNLPHPYQYAHPPLPTVPHQFIYPGQFFPRPSPYFQSPFLHTLQHPLPISPIGNTDPYLFGQHVLLLPATSFPLSYPVNTSPLTFTGTLVPPPLLEEYRPEENLPVGFISEHDAFPYSPGNIAPVGYPANPFEPAFFLVEDLMEPSLVPDYQLPLLAPPINLDQYGSYSFPPFAEFPPEPMLPEENFPYTQTENNMPLTMDYVPLPYMSPSSWIRPRPSFVELLPPAEYPPMLPTPLPLHPLAENALQTLLPTEYPAVFEEDYLLLPNPLGTDSLIFLPASFPFPFTYTSSSALPEPYLDPLQYISELPPILEALYPQDFSVEGPPPLYPGSHTVDPPIHFPEGSLLSPDTQIIPDNERHMSNHGPCPLHSNTEACGSLPPVLLMLTCDDLSMMMPDLSGTLRLQLYTLLNQAGAQVVPPNMFSNWKPEPNYSQEPLPELPFHTLSENLVFPNIHLDWAPSPEVSNISQLSFDNYS